MYIIYILRMSFLVISFSSFILIYVGWRNLKSILKQLSKKEDKEIVDEETKRAIMRGAWFIAAGTIIASVFNLVAILLK